MRIVVTGGAGFLGSYVTEELRGRLHDVTVLRSRDYDLRQRLDIGRALADSDPEVVVHLAAAVGGIGANVEEPGRFFYENAIMGVELMEQARRYGVRKFVTIGTVCEYPRDLIPPFFEEELWKGYPAEATAPYALAKKMLLVQAQAYREQYGFDSIHLLPTNLYGPRDNFDLENGHVVAAMVRKFVEAVHAGADSVTCWGSGAPTRDFLHASDAARAIADATEQYSAPEPVNIATGVEVRMQTLANLVAEAAGFDGQIVWDRQRPEGTPRRALNVSRIHDLGWTPVYTLEAGIAQTVEWYEENR